MLTPCTTQVAFTETLASMGITKYTRVSTMDGVRKFADNLRAGGKPEHSVTLFAFADYFPAVATTDVLSRVADVVSGLRRRVPPQSLLRFCLCRSPTVVE